MRNFLHIAGIVLSCTAFGLAQASSPVAPEQELARVGRELQETRAELKESRRQIEELRQGLEELRGQVQANAGPAVPTEAAVVPPVPAQPAPAEPTVSAADQDPGAELTHGLPPAQPRALVHGDYMPTAIDPRFLLPAQVTGLRSARDPWSGILSG